MYANPNNKLMEEDMKKRNQFMVNKLIKEDRWLEFNLLVSQMDMMLGHGWDEAVPDDGGMKDVFESMIKGGISNVSL